MKKCPNCGTKNADSAQQCNFCDTKLAEEIKAETKSADYVHDEKTEKKRRLTGRILLVVVIAFIAVVAFCVGASPADNPEIEQTLPKNFSEEELKNIKWFYCPGGLDYEKMSVTSRMMMKTFVKFLKAKKDKTEEDLEQIRIMSSSYDISNIKYIEPIIDYLNG